MKRNLLYTSFDSSHYTTTPDRGFPSEKSHRNSEMIERKQRLDMISQRIPAHRVRRLIETSSSSTCSEDEVAGPSRGHEKSMNFNNPKNPNKRKSDSSDTGPSKSGRYFDDVITVSSEEEEKSSANIVKMSSKRKMAGELPEYISLNNNEEGPQLKRSKLDTSRENSQIPYSRRESRLLFEKDMCSSQIRRFYDVNKQKDAFLAKKNQLRQAIQNAVNRAAIAKSQLFLVGSSVNGFGRITSDADFCLMIDRHVDCIEDRRRIMRVLFEIQSLLRKAPFIRNLRVIRAKVPILKFVDSYTGMECDLNVNNLTGVRNTELLKRYSLLDPRLQPLLICVKEWAHQNEINDASQGTLSSYSICLMVINFLQCGTHPPVLPSLQQNHPGLFARDIPIAQLENNASRIPSYRSANQLSLSQLMRCFFHYYANKFNFAMNVISVRLGRTMKVNEMDDPHQWLTKDVKIEEPFDRSNTARAVFNKGQAERIFRCFKQANVKLQRSKDLRAIIDNVPRSFPVDDVVVLDD